MKNTKSEANKVVLTVSPKGISMETKFLLKPVGIFLIIISLLIGSIYFSLGQINKVNAKIAESENGLRKRGNPPGSGGIDGWVSAKR